MGRSRRARIGALGDPAGNAPAQEAFPQAQVHAVPGVAAKQPKVRIDAELGEKLPDAWRDTFSTVAVEGSPVLGEVAVLHKPTRTLIVADLAFHLLQSDHWLTRAAMKLNDGYGRFGPTRLVRATFRDRKAARKSLDRILDWDFDRVVLAHGEVLEHGGREALAAAYSWL